MKKAIALAAALIASSAQATSGLDFGDLNYFLKSGQFNLTSNVNIIDQEVKPEGAARTQTRGYVLDNRLGYGIADNLNAFVGVDYAFQYENQQKGISDEDAGGLSNPYIGATYRLMNQKDADYNVDIGAIARIKVMDAELGGAGEDGTYNRGNHSVEVNAAIGHKWNEANEWRLTGAVVRNLEGETELGSTDVDTTASTDFSLTAAYQYRPVQEFMMAVALQALRVGEFDYEASGADATSDSHLDYNFTFNAKYLITETFIARFNYGMSRLEEYDLNDIEQKKRRANFYGFGIDWLF